MTTQDRHQRALREREFLCAIVAVEQLSKVGQGKVGGDSRVVGCERPEGARAADGAGGEVGCDVRERESGRNLDNGAADARGGGRREEGGGRTSESDILPFLE